jgi:hypothetical protein
MSTSAPKLARMYSLGLDTIAGVKLRQLKFRPAGLFQPVQSVVHRDRRARFIRAQDGSALVRHSGDSRPIAVPLEALSLPAPTADCSRVRSLINVATRPSGTRLEGQRAVNEMAVMPSSATATAPLVRPRRRAGPALRPTRSPCVGRTHPRIPARYVAPQRSVRSANECRV